MAPYPIYTGQTNAASTLPFSPPPNQPLSNIHPRTMNSNFQPMMNELPSSRMPQPVSYINHDPNAVRLPSNMNVGKIQNNSTQQHTSNMHQTNDSTPENSEKGDIPTDKETELLILIDSNSNHINRRQFWTLDKTKWVRCGMINEAMRVVSETIYPNLKYLLLSVGVNDTDDVDGHLVAERITELIDVVHHQYPEVKIIVNELTPRMDDRDGEVTKCNKALVPIVAQDDLLFLAKQTNLRDKSFFRDNKHIKSEKIGRYVANIKTELRNAYGMEDPRKTNHSAKFDRVSPRFSRRPQDQNNFHNNKLGHYQNQTRSSADDELKVNLRRLFALLQ